ENYEDYYIDEIYLNLSSHLWLTNNWEADFEIGVGSSLIPKRLDLRAIKRFNNIGITMGFENRPFFIYEAELYYTEPSTSFFINHHPDLSYSYIQFDLFIFGPYTGINYTFENDKIIFRGDINTGLSFNNKDDYYVTLKERNSNYTWSEEYFIKSSPAMWLNPELYFYVKLFGFYTFDMGIRVSAGYYLTQKKLTYDYIERQWTYENTEQQHMKPPTHLMHQLNADFGISIRIK
ncbi:MAG: hypothetical protein PF489_12010, partial [Salinivirgaceae bacterium]|nr:hypothetical protein [Salinivirgaceae bacterium]